MKNKKPMGIKNRTLITVSLVSAIAFIIFTVFFMGFYYKNFLTELRSDGDFIISNTSGHLESYVSEVSALANDANYSYYLQNFLIGYNDEEEFRQFGSGKEMQNYTMSSKSFNNVINTRSDINSLMVFRENGPVLYRTINKYINVMGGYEDYDWYKNALENPKGFIVTGPVDHAFFAKNTDKTLTLTRQISSYIDGSNLGVMLIEFNMNEIARILNSVNMENSGTLGIINSEGQVILEHSIDPLYKGVIKSNVSEIYEYTGVHDVATRVNLNGDNYQLISHEMVDYGWTIVILYPESVLYQSYLGIGAIIIMTFIVIMAVVILVLHFALDRIVHPIITLKEQMDAADHGNLDIFMEIERFDETGMLTTSFNNLLERIRNLMTQVVDEETKKRSYELQALQSQINPHFLYNTLESFVWMAEKKDDRLVPMIESLAKLFRLTLNKGSERTTLRKEIEHVEHYLFIQNFRYKDKFTYDLSYDKNLGDVKLIKLILQPIVENSIYHGLKNKRGKGYINVSAREETGLLIIEVEDNGIGIPEDRLKELNNGLVVESSMMGSGIAVSNINERIKLAYGNDYGISFKSIEGEGSLAIIRLPLEGDKYEKA